MAAKPLMFASLLVGQVVVAAGVGVVYARYPPSLPSQERQTWERGLLIALSMWLVTMVVVTPIIGGGLFGFSLPNSAASYMFTTLLSLVMFGVSLTQLRF